MTAPTPAELAAEAKSLADAAGIASKDYGVALAQRPGFTQAERISYLTSRAALHAAIDRLAALASGKQRDTRTIDELHGRKP